MSSSVSPLDTLLQAEREFEAAQQRLAEATAALRSPTSSPAKDTSAPPKKQEDGAKKETAEETSPEVDQATVEELRRKFWELKVKRAEDHTSVPRGDVWKAWREFKNAKWASSPASSKSPEGEEDTPEHRRVRAAKSRFRELKMKRWQDPESVDPEEMRAARAELWAARRAAYPDAFSHRPGPFGGFDGPRRGRWRRWGGSFGDDDPASSEELPTSPAAPASPSLKKKKTADELKLDAIKSARIAYLELKLESLKKPGSVSRWELRRAKRAIREAKEAFLESSDSSSEEAFDYEEFRGGRRRRGRRGFRGPPPHFLFHLRDYYSDMPGRP